MTLRADPDPERAKRGGSKLPVRVTRARRRAWAPWLKRTLRWGGIGAVVLALGGAGYAVTRPGALAGFMAATGHGSLAATGALGLKVRQILVEGRSRVPAPTVMATLGVHRGMPILGVGVGDVRQRLETIPWVESALVERRLPDTIFVRLTERQPLALWQHNGRFSVIDAKGAVVQDEVGEFAHLPIVVGDDAPVHAEALLLLLATEPDLQKRVTAAVRVGDRRWNLKLDNGIDVRLPEEDAASAWSRLATLERDNKLLSRDVVAIDLRLPDRLIVRVGADTAPAPVPQERTTRRPAAR
ncbi:MAG: FtsQ-type POTRA domain-containing protein [Proteobacteria bacterium]|nr:FtsQ-type POTRA domain-containing protein [Pseudomonadota bacterium]